MVSLSTLSILIIRDLEKALKSFKSLNKSPYKNMERRFNNMERRKMADQNAIRIQSDALASLLGLWSFTLVNERLVDAMRLWQRAPGKTGPGSGSPFARDIPAELITRENEAGDYDARGGDLDAAPMRTAAATRAELAERDEASAWLAFVPPADRRLVNICLHHQAKGAARIPWAKIKREMGMALGVGGLARRYSMAITAICNQLNKPGGSSPR
jgi:hypothetical protein